MILSYSGSNGGSEKCPKPRSILRVGTTEFADIVGMNWRKSRVAFDPKDFDVSR